MPSARHELDRLQEVEFPPFQAAIKAEVKLIMSAHFALPAMDGPEAPPASMSATIIRGILREKMGYTGVVVSDAMDIQGIRQGGLLGEDAVRAASADVDLLLLSPNPIEHRSVFESLSASLKKGTLDSKIFSSSVERIASLKTWLREQFPPYGLHIIRCIEHQAVAVEIAERSITLVRDEGNTLPLKLRPDQRVAVIIPRTADLTPADSFFGIKPVLASMLREIHPNVDEFTVPLAPEDADISTVLQQISGHDLVVCATLNAFETNGQIKLVRQVLKTGKPCVVVAMRLPYDLNAFPEAPTYLCTYGIQESSMSALARALMGLVPLTGHLPVSIPGLYPAGYARSKPWS
jgi:beta-N-acetylhexosaminidase